MEKKTRKPAASKAKAETKKVTATKATKSAAEPKSDAYAIFETGGKQYGVKAGDIVRIEKVTDKGKKLPIKYFDKFANPVEKPVFSNV